MKARTNYLFAWNKSEVDKHDSLAIHTIIKEIRNNDGITDEQYNPDDNVKALCRLLAYSMPGNTLDVFYESLAKTIHETIETGNTELLLTRFHTENLLRIVVNELADME